MCGGLALVGVSLSFASSLPATMVLFTAAFLVAGDLAMSFAVGRDEANMPLRNVLRFVCRTSLLAGTGCVALVGWNVLLGAWVLLAVAVITCSSPYLIRLNDLRLRDRRVTSSPGQQGDTIGEAPPLPAVEKPPTPESGLALRSWSDLELCRAWCASFLALQETPWQSQRILIVAERQRYLDEFARRNPEGLLAWLASGARAGANPGRYMIQSATQIPRSIDWDELIPRSDR
jgi:hypothetical protein